MSSSRDVGTPRLVGRVVDPLARDDGADQPEVELQTDELTEAPEPPVMRRVSDEPGESVGTDGSRPSRHPVRDRLLARAEMARQARATAVDETDQESSDRGSYLPASMPRALEDELDRVASRRPPSPPRAIGRRARLPANMAALFGGLFGCAVVGALFAVLIHLDPRDGLAPAPAAVAPEPAEDDKAPEAPEPPVRRERQKLPGPWRIVDSKDSSLKKIEGRIGREPFLRAIQEAGLEKTQAYRVLIALKDQRNLDKCAHTDRFAALVERSTSKVKAFEYIVSKEEVYQAREGNDGLLKGQRLDLKVERHRVQGAILLTGSSFAEAAREAGFEKDLAGAVDEALEGHASSGDFQRGDRFRIVAQEVTVLGEFSRYAGIEAIEYLPVDGDPLRIYYFRGEKSHGYFDVRARAPYEGGWRKPIPDAPITSRFNPKRMHPVLKKVMPHNGTDFGAPTGTPVGSSSPGTVSHVGYAGPSGNLVLVDHAGGYETGYAHLSRFADGLKVGDRVGRLQVVGYVGSTGRSTGPHLHFSAKKNGAFVDPESLQLDAMRVLPKEERDEFNKVRAEYDRMLEAVALPKPLQVDRPAPEPSSAEIAEAAPATPEPAAAPEPAPEKPEPPKADVPSEPAKPEPPPAAPRPLAKAPPQAGSRSIYLTDKELMETQGAADDGEVEE